MSDPTSRERSEGLHQAIRARAATLDGLLQRYERAVACTELDVADTDLRRHLDEQRAAVAVEVAEAMLHWRRLGGEIAFASDGPVPAPVSAPAVEAPPIDRAPSGGGRLARDRVSAAR